MEMMNTSPTDTIDLTDVHFEAGLDFTFTGSLITSLAPGERVLIVSNRSAFETRYGTAFSHRIAGEFGPNRLDNAGERLHLVDALGGTIADFTYNDKLPWPTEAGFAGYSLVLAAPAIDEHDYGTADNWFGGEASFPLVSEVNQGDGTSLVTRRSNLPHTPATKPAFFLRLRAHSLGRVSFADWMAEQGASDPQAPFRSSSLSNLLAYAVGADLAPVPEAALPGFTTVTDGGITYPAISYRARKGAGDVTYTVEISENLVDWDNGAAFTAQVVSPVVNGDGTETVTVRSLLSIASAPGQFLRLHIGLLL